MLKKKNCEKGYVKAIKKEEEEEENCLHLKAGQR
jgi:hypothetical protein